MDEAKPDANITAIAIAENNSKLFLGKTGEWWDAGLIASLVFGAIAAGAVLVFTTGTINAHKREAEDAERQVEALKKTAAELEKGTAALKAETEVSRARVAEAELALQKFKSPRVITSETQSRLFLAAKGIGPKRFDISVIPGDPEAIALVGQISGPLRDAGWEWIEWNHPNGPMMNVYTVPGMPNFGQGGWIGIDVQVHPDHKDEFLDAAVTLALALNKSGLDAKAGEVTMLGIPNHDTLHIIIGKKPIN